MFFLSIFQVEPILKARREGKASLRGSLDLGLTFQEITLSQVGIEVDGEALLPWSELEEIARRETHCFLVERGKATHIHRFSPQFNRAYSLHPTPRAPTMILAGFPMHRIKDIDPWEDTDRKVRCLSPVRGAVLDTSTGLGYTAIRLARTADSVTTIELDPTVLELCRQNPWSQNLFDNPKIEQLIGDSFEVIQSLPGGKYSAILHDPPTFKLAGQLYSGEFYAHLRRVLRRGGSLFHYVGDFSSAQGDSVARGAIRRLHEAGFPKVERRPEAFGLLCA